MKKECSKCFQKKKLDKFSKSKTCLYGVNSFCKVCDNLIRLDYSRTKKGVISTLYATQKNKSIKRKHNPPTYTKDELESYLLTNKKFKKLYKKWVESDYNTELKPSCDRINDYLGYSFDNIKIVTWGVNNSNGYLDRIEGKNNKTNKEVNQLTKLNVVVNTFHSVAEASRFTKISYSAINNCCLGISKTSGGFIWRYTDG